MKQVNQATGKTRDIREPRRWKAPSAPLVPKGKTTVVTVPPGAPGTVIQVPYPGEPGKFIAVNVPPSAKPGQAMLVPVPDKSDSTVTSGGGGGGGAEAKSGGWSTGAKV